MKYDKLINGLHNTIDYYKDDITKLLKEGTQELALTFSIKPDEVISLEIKCDKIATKSFNKLEPFTIWQCEEEDK